MKKSLMLTIFTLLVPLIAFGQTTDLRKTPIQLWDFKTMRVTLKNVTSSKNEPVFFQTPELFVCNKGSVDIAVAVLNEKRSLLFGSSWSISGWRWISPGRCPMVIHVSQLLHVVFGMRSSSGEFGIVKLNFRGSRFDASPNNRLEAFCVSENDMDDSGFQSTPDAYYPPCSEGYKAAPVSKSIFLEDGREMTLDVSPSENDYKSFSVVFGKSPAPPRNRPTPSNPIPQPTPDPAPSTTSKDSEQANALREQRAGLLALLLDFGFDALKSGHYKEALKSFDDLVSKEPSYSSALAGRAQANFYLRNFKDAIDDANRAIEGKNFAEQSHRAIAHKIRAHVYAYHGETTQARSDYVEALRLGGEKMKEELIKTFSRCGIDVRNSSITLSMLDQFMQKECYLDDLPK